MTKQFFKDSLGWGIMLWIIGYLLGIILFPIVAPSAIGWYIMPIGIVFTLSALLKKVKGDSLRYYALVAVVWTLLAVVLDHLLIVKAFHPADGYYKLDVYLYYALTFLMPLSYGWWKLK